MHVVCFYLVPPPPQYSTKIFNSISLALGENTIKVVVVAVVVVVVVVAAVVVVLVVIVVSVVVVIVVDSLVYLGGRDMGPDSPKRITKKFVLTFLICCSQHTPWFFIVFFGNILDSATLFFDFIHLS